MMANSGFMLMGTFSFLSPTALSFTTPTEFLPYGWTTMDIWAAPLITGLYSMLTHAQPFWATSHAFLATALGVAPTVPGGSTPPYGEKSGEMKDPSGLPQSPAVAPVDAETARAACALLLMVMFAGRTTRNFGGVKVIQGWLGQAKDPQGQSLLTIDRDGLDTNINPFGSTIEEDAMIPAIESNSNSNG
jgi:hypothetical protein